MLRMLPCQDDLGQDARPFMCLVEAASGGGVGDDVAFGCCVVDVAAGQVRNSRWHPCMRRERGDNRLLVIIQSAIINSLKYSLKTLSRPSLPPQARVGSFRERSAARPVLCTALVRFDPVEVLCTRGAVSGPTLAALDAHCRPAGGAGEGAVLSPLAPGVACASVAEARALLAGALPPLALQALAAQGFDGQQEQQQWRQPGAAQGSSGGGLDGLGAMALAMAVRQLQRCGMAEELLPTLLLAPLEVDGASDTREHLGGML